MTKTRYNNIMYICGNDSFSKEREKIGIIDLFKKKYGDESIEKYSLDYRENFKQYSDNIQSVWLFTNARLFVFSGGIMKKTKKTEKTNNQSFDNYLEKIANTLSDSDFLLFYNISEWEAELKKWLEKYASIREKKLSFRDSDWEKYTTLSTPILKKILSLYENAEKFRDRWQDNAFLWHSIFQSLKNLEILEKTTPITDEIIENFSHHFAWATIFKFLDQLLLGNIIQAKKILEKIQSQINNTGDLEKFISSLVSNLRKYIYILRLRDLKLSQKEIEQQLPDIKPFIIGNVYKSRINSQSLAKFYQKIILSTIAYRSGKWMKKTILWRFFEIDTALLELKK